MPGLWFCATLETREKGEKNNAMGCGFWGYLEKKKKSIFVIDETYHNNGGKLSK